MNNIYKVYVHGTALIEAHTEPEAIDIALDVDLVDGILKSELDIWDDDIEFTANNPCPLATTVLNNIKDPLSSGCINISLCKKSLNFCFLKHGFNNPTAYLYTIKFSGILYIEAFDEEDVRASAICSSAINTFAERERWTNIETIHLLPKQLFK